MWDESAAIYEHALKLWEGLSQDLNFNVMFSQRGVLTISHSEHELMFRVTYCENSALTKHYVEIQIL